MDVLILEDDFDHGELFRAALNKINLNPIIAADIDEIENFIYTDKINFDFAILDVRIGMELYAGLEFGQKLRESHPQIPIIFVSALYQELEDKMPKYFPENTPFLLPKENIYNTKAFCEVLDKLIYSSLSDIGSLSAIAEGVLINLGEGNSWKTFIKFSDIIFLESITNGSTLIHLDKNSNYFEDPKKHEIEFTRNIGSIAPQIIGVCPSFYSIMGARNDCHFCINLKRLKKFRLVPNSGISYIKLEGFHDLKKENDYLSLNQSETFSFKQAGIILNRQNGK